MSVLWPRLSPTIAGELITTFRDLDLNEIESAAATSHPSQTFASSGGARATERQIAALKDTIHGVAETHGYPQPAGDAARVRFDRELAPLLLDHMPMADGEALNRDVWSFTSVVVAPHITHWRFVRGSAWNMERWVCTDRTRHMFARCWWQAKQLTLPVEGGRDTTLLDALSESELNHVTERTSIGGCAPLAQALARAVTAIPDGGNRRETARQACLLLLRRTAVIDPYTLDVDQLDRLAEESVAAAAPSAGR